MTHLRRSLIFMAMLTAGTSFAEVNSACRGLEMPDSIDFGSNISMWFHYINSTTEDNFDRRRTNLDSFGETVNSYGYFSGSMSFDQFKEARRSLKHRFDFEYDYEESVTYVRSFLPPEQAKHLLDCYLAHQFGLWAVATNVTDKHVTVLVQWKGTDIPSQSFGPRNLSVTGGVLVERSTNTVSNLNSFRRSYEFTRQLSDNNRPNEFVLNIDYLSTSLSRPISIPGDSPELNSELGRRLYCVRAGGPDTHSCHGRVLYEEQGRVSEQRCEKLADQWGAPCAIWQTMGNCEVYSDQVKDGCGGCTEKVTYALTCTEVP